MKLNIKSNQITGNSSVEKTNFKVNNNAHMIKTLTDKLYSNKHEAVIRELVANAVDANIESGTKLPTEVSLPKAGGSQDVVVRDHGKGMSHKFVMKIYSTFFASTKTTNEDVTGAYGLGSKSPFALTDQFNIETATAKDFEKGVKRLYNCAKDEQGMPFVHFIGETPSGDFGIGSKVYFNTPDTNEWTSACNSLAASLLSQDISIDGKPVSEVLGKNLVEVPDFGGVHVLTDEDTSITSELNRNTFFEKTGSTPIYGGSIILIMGMGQFTIRHDDNTGLSSDTIRKLKAISTCFNRTAHITVPIGTFNVPPSREGIEWDKYSVKGVTEIIDKLFDKISETIEEHFYGPFKAIQDAYKIEQAKTRELEREATDTSSPSLATPPSIFSMYPTTRVGLVKVGLLGDYFGTYDTSYINREVMEIGSKMIKNRVIPKSSYETPHGWDIKETKRVLFVPRVKYSQIKHHYSNIQSLVNCRIIDKLGADVAIIVVKPKEDISSVIRVMAKLQDKFSGVAGFDKGEYDGGFEFIDLSLDADLMEELEEYATELRDSVRTTGRKPTSSRSYRTLSWTSNTRGSSSYARMSCTKDEVKEMAKDNLAYMFYAQDNHTQGYVPSPLQEMLGLLDNFPALAGRKVVAMPQAQIDRFKRLHKCDWPTVQEVAKQVFDKKGPYYKDFTKIVALASLNGNNYRNGLPSDYVWSQAITNSIGNTAQHAKHYPTLMNNILAAIVTKYDHDTSINVGSSYRSDVMELNGIHLEGIHADIDYKGTVDDIIDVMWQIAAIAIRTIKLQPALMLDTASYNFMASRDIDMGYIRLK